MTTAESVKALLESADYGQRLSGINQLRSLDPKIALALIQPAIADANVRVRYAAVSQLSTLGLQDPQACLPSLLNCLNNDPEPDIQAAAADSLSALRLTEAYDDLQRAYEQSPEWLVQFSIVAALGELGEPRAFDLLVGALQSETELIRTAAIGALGELGDERAIALLLPEVTNPDWQVRQRVAQALSNFHTPEVQAAMAALAQDEVEPIRQQAQLYLEAVG
jgi:HEAT repeat protein